MKKLLAAIGLATLIATPVFAKTEEAVMLRALEQIEADSPDLVVETMYDMRMLYVAVRPNGSDRTGLAEYFCLVADTDIYSPMLVLVNAYNGTERLARVICPADKEPTPEPVAEEPENEPTETADKPRNRSLLHMLFRD